MNTFIEMTAEQAELEKKISRLIDQQDALKVHHYRTKQTVLTADDHKFNDLQTQIDAINNQLGQV